jgi:hypothetical protein
MGGREKFEVGSAYYATQAEIGAILRRRYDQRVLDMNAYLRRRIAAGELTPEAAARIKWEWRNRHRLQTRNNPFAQPIATEVWAHFRGDMDMPSWERLRKYYRDDCLTKGITPTEEVIDLRIINSGPNRFPARLASAAKWGGRVCIAIDVGVTFYDVANAPEGQKGKVLAINGGRMAGAATGGAGCAWYFGIGGAILGGPIGAGIGAALGGLIGSWAGGTVGEVIAEDITK